jgi:hypothetical protein
VADLDALREALEAALRALDAPDVDESADERRRRIDRERKRRARTNADTNRGQNADRTRTNADTDQGKSRGIPSPPHPPRRGGGVESPADNSADRRGQPRTNADADNRGRAPTDLSDWRADRAPLTDEEAAAGKAGLDSARAALRARRSGS